MAGVLRTIASAHRALHSPCSAEVLFAEVIKHKAAALCSLNQAITKVDGKVPEDIILAVACHSCIDVSGTGFSPSGPSNKYAQILTIE
jgi:hypothetical protein